MDAATDTDTHTDKPPDQPVYTFSEVEWEFLQPYVTDGWRVLRRRRQPLLCPLAAQAKVALGERAAEVDRLLEERRQAKNARAAALIRERNGHQGAIHQIRRRFQAGTDEIGRRMSLEDRAAYAERIAALQGAYDTFEEARKAEIAALVEDLADLDEQASSLAVKIRHGKGNQPVSVVDLGRDGVSMTLRLDTLAWVSTTRGRQSVDGGVQLDLLPDPPAPEAEPLSDHEYALAISGRVHDASHAYVVRLGLGLSITAAAKIVRALLPDEELPPEAEDEGEVPPVASEAPAEGDEGGGDELPPEAGALLEEGEPPEPPPETFDVVIKEIKPRRKVKVGLVLHDQRWDAATGWSATEALSTLPLVAHEGVLRVVAADLAEQLTEAGAIVEVVPHVAAPAQPELVQ